MNRSVLIVEDEYVVANSLRLLLKKAGYQVFGIAESVEEAGSLIEKRKPELVILDIRLNGQRNGIELAKKLKAEHIAFVYLSANSDQQILEEAKATEPYGFLVKPFREKDLLITLDIAWYRHSHSYESKVREELYLRESLSEIELSRANAQSRLLSLAKLFQPHIPFDIFLFLGIAQGKEPGKICGYERLGYDKYRFIGNLNELDFVSMTGNTSNPDPGPLIATEAEYIKDSAGGAELTAALLQKKTINHFHMESSLSVPVMLAGKPLGQYLFLSRQRNSFTQDHHQLLNRLNDGLSVIARKLSADGDEGNAPEEQLLSNQAGSLTTGRHPSMSDIIGEHPLLHTVLDLTAQVAKYSTSVLILGESGTGKEKIAQSIHLMSVRKNAAFIKINCGAIPETLIESELFGHEKGSFTGAIEKRKGRFEQADGGTLFLDEVGELSLEMQIKLLRVLQEREITPIGANLPQKVNVRIVAATNRNLEKEIAENRFRLDLYYRLNVFPITLPPLRERKSDIKALSLYFAKRFSAAFGKDVAGISVAMMEQMHRYNWPGNIRELENVIERSVILNDGQTPLTLTQRLASITEETSPKSIQTLDDVKILQRETEKDYIISVLKQTRGRIRGVSGAAELLNIKPTTLESKIARLGILRTDF